MVTRNGKGPLCTRHTGRHAVAHRKQQRHRQQQSMFTNNHIFLLLFSLCLLIHTITAEYIREFEISEGVPVGTRIGFISEDRFGLSSSPPSRYLIVPVPGSAVDSDLHIDQSTGEIRTKIVLDREVRSSYSLVAIPLSGENIRVVIQVKDENDNSPTFPSSVMTIEFPENTPRDVKRTLYPAKDLDLGIYNTQRYSIASGNANNAFRLSSHRERDGVLYLDLQVNGFLDRETTPFYSLLIEAFDGGNPPLKGTILVNITIQDVNDNQPIFNQSRYFATIPENATIATSVLQVFATDTDSDDNGAVTYTINRRQSDKDSMFRISSKTGIIAVNRNLDFEIKETHELVVVARDNGAQPLETTAFVSIRVTDVNDNQPVIRLIFLSDDATPKITENSKPGEFVARISVHDPDSKEEYANINVTLEGGDGHFGLTTHDNIIYLVIVSQPLDREIRANYTLSVIATDQGNPPLNTSKTFHLQVMDINDNAPEFDRTVYYANVLEVADPGTSVFQVSAIDSDTGNNSIVTYAIRDTPETHSEWFQIESKSGLITTRSHIDCETDPMPQLTVIANDNGKPPLSATATVIVTIRDVNDNEPIFDQSFYNVTVAEGEDIGHCILKVSATDPDCGVNAMVNYTIGDGFGRFPEFKVQTTTGAICLARPLDYETRSNYEFPIVATDRGGLSTTAMVKIQVIDVNDNRPTFYPREYNVSLREDEVPPVTPVVVIAATDNDSGKFGLVRFSIVDGNSDGAFRIDTDTGGIYVTRPLKQNVTPIRRLTVSASDGFGLQSDADASVLVSVINSHQKPPLFDKSRYSFNVKEDLVTGSVVGVVTATTGNRGESRVLYSISSGDPNGYFRIDPTSGTIRTAAPLDHEKHSSALLSVQATSGTPPSFGHAQVNIIVADINDNSPEFDSNFVKISVPENAAVGTTLYVAQARDKDGGNNGVVRYSLLVNPSGIFKIDPRSGALIVARSLDYEVAQKHRVIISAADQGLPTRKMNLTLDLEVQDVNDNPPNYPKSQYDVGVPESLPVNSQFLQVTAIDRDTGNNARITYRLVNQTTFGAFPNSGWLYLKENLDRESRDRYSLTVLAVDNGSPAKTATAVVNVRVLDANDNDPQFERSVYEFEVEENRSARTVVGRVSAADRDLDNNGSLQYALTKANSSFHIDPTTGVITTLRFLDREQQSSYEFVAEVRDHGKPPRSAQAVVRITVSDVNDNSPVIIEPDESVLSVREEQPTGTEMARFQGVDADQGANATVTYALIESEDADGFSSFAIDATTGILRTKQVLDHEEKALYTIAIAVRDQGTPPRETVQLFRVEVLDLNDNRPTFTSSSFMFKVSEGVPVGHELGIVTAVDEDSGENGRVTYTLINGNSYGSFDINKTTGAVFTAREIDHEMATEYLLKIKAVDNSATNPQSNIINVQIDVLDINDSPPVFVNDPVLFSVSENTAVGTLVWTFNASDDDVGTNGAVKYVIIQQSPKRFFRLDADSGALYVSEPLDYEKYQDHTIVVIATDQAENVTERLSSSVTARIIVEDFNDHTPVFVSRNRADIMEDEPIGFPVLQIIATDLDSRDNGRVTYVITSGNHEGRFLLDYESGLLTINKPLDREKSSQYLLNITASDHGKVPKSLSQIIKIYVEDVNDNQPQFEQDFYEASVSEDAILGTFVVKVTATDKDLGPNANLTFLIPEGIGEGKFMVDPESGAVSTSSHLDRESKASYILTVYVRDSSFPSQYDTCTINITVLDVNDHSPQFHDSCYPLYIPENSDLSVIHTVLATDCDIGRNGEITYSISSGNVDNKFSIDLHTGKLSSRPLDREARSQYQLTITAHDQGSPSLTGLCNLTVIVEDQNDNDPQFEQQRYISTVPEDIPPHSSILTVKATDKDLGVNSKLTYSLNNETQWLFRIDNKTGVITTTGPMDHEKWREYSFEVVATDGGRYDARSEKVQVHIIVSDINDNKPIFLKYPFTAEVPAYTRPAQHLVQVIAVDKDEGPNADIVYSFVHEPPNFKFRIDPTSGIITATSSFMMESGKSFHLEVMAQDKGNPSQSSTGLVEIRVGDSSDNSITTALRFQNSTYEIYLKENAIAGTDVVQVSAIRTDGRRQRVTYSFGGGNEDNTFEINSNNGLVRVRDSQRLDFENTSRLRLIIVAQADGTVPLYGYATVWVNLMDENDNAPMFNQERYMSAVWEGNNKGTFVTQVSATDADQGTNSNILYHIIDGNHDNAFIIEPPFSGIVKTNIVLDREIQDSYRLTIIATDEGVPQMTGSCTLRINVVDVNDNQPTFPPFSSFNVSEGAEIGTLVTTISANDVDTNPALTYDFGVGGNPGGVFNVDRFSGKVTLAQPLDYERKTSYTLGIRASDTVHRAEAMLTVNVLDENDNPPVFEKQFYQVLLPSLPKSGQPVLRVHATDPDQGSNGRVHYSLLTPMEGFSIDSNTGDIHANSTLDYNPKEPIRQLVVTASDKGKPSLSAVAAVRIQILDINNNPPKFHKELYTAHISEDAPRGTTVIKVSASDIDETLRHVDYSIVSGNIDHVFQISSITGEVILVKTVNRETTALYNIQIMATDRGIPSRNTTTDVQIFIDDVNDHAPTFNQSEYAVHISEAASVGHTILRLSAVDLDEGDNANVHYDITSGNDHNNFQLDPVTGLIILRKALDFDKVSEYRFIVRATDGSSPDSLSTLATVYVKVEDYNDNSPQFPVHLYIEFVPENEPAGTTVFAAHANDLDRGIFGKLNYTITEGGGKDKFRINSITGVITTAMVFDFELKSRYYFTIMAMDMGGKYAVVQVQIDIESRDEYAPEFTETAYHFAVAGNADAGYIVGHVRALDKDKGSDGRVLYHLRNHNQYFKINKTSGAILTKKKLQGAVKSRDKRETSNINLVIVASSGKPGSLSSVAMAEISVDSFLTAPGLATVDSANTGMADWAVGLLITLLLLVLGLGAAFLFIHLRKQRHGKPAMAESFDSTFDTIDIRGRTSAALSQFPPPQYKDIPPYAPPDRRHHHHTNTTSELSDQSHSASSGRGSAEEEAEDVEDEEIRMINEGQLVQQKIRLGMPDSGVHDDDNLSDNSVHNTQEYLARLGINTSRQTSTKSSSNNRDLIGQQSMDSMHMFDDEGGGEGDGISNLMFMKETSVTEGRGSSRGFNDGSQPSMTGSLSSIVHSEEELTGSYNWDYLLDWGPQFQPLAHVFTEIARLKDDNEPVPKKHPSNKPLPPPLLTNIAPRTIVPLPLSTSNRSSHLPTLPRSPISHESSFTTPALSPSFSPALSPLATRSPSISPLVTPGLGPGACVVASGSSTTHHTRPKRLVSGSTPSGSEAEFRI